MENLNLAGLTKWLEITDQQLQIIQSIHGLELSKKETSPKNIEKEYHRRFRRRIQKPNLFSILKNLQQKDLISRSGQAIYLLDFEGIERALNRKKADLHDEEKDLHQVSEDVKHYFDSISKKTEIPIVQYYDYEGMFNKMADLLQDAHTYYVVSKFANILYTYELAKGSGIDRYVETLWDRCFNKKDLRILYLTQMGIDYPFQRFYNVFNDVEAAYEECLLILERLKTHTKRYENLEIHHLKYPYGLDILLPEGERLDQFFLFIRDRDEMAIGGIYVKSEEMAKRFKEMFLRECQRASLVRGREARILSKNLKKDLNTLPKKIKKPTH